MKSRNSADYGAFVGAITEALENRSLQLAYDAAKRCKLLPGQASDSVPKRQVRRQETGQEAGTEGPLSRTRTGGAGVPTSRGQSSASEDERRGKSLIVVSWAVGCGRAAALSKARQNTMERTTHVIKAAVMPLIKQFAYPEVDSGQNIIPSRQFMRYMFNTNIL